MARGFEVSFETGAAARAALHTDGGSRLLRVVWAPDANDLAARRRLRGLLGAEIAGDVMVLASATPRGVIDAVIALTAAKPRAPRPNHRRTYLEHPTSVERVIAPRGWIGSAIAARAVAAAVVVGVVARDRSREPPTKPGMLAATIAPGEPARNERRDEVLATTRPTPVADEDDEPWIVVEPPPRRRTRAAVTTPPEAGALPVEAAPLDGAPQANTSAMPASGASLWSAPSDAIVRVDPPSPRVIDPF